MAFQTREQYYFSNEIITINRQQLVINEVAEATFNNPVQMGGGNPFATTLQDPGNSVNQQQPNAPQISAHRSVRSNIQQNGRRKHFGSGSSTESQSKRLKTQFLERSAGTPIQNIFKENDAEMLNLGNLNMALQEDVKNSFVDYQKWREYATIWEIKTMSDLQNNLEIARAEVRRLQGLLPPLNAAEEQDFTFYYGSNVSIKNAPSNAQVVAVQDVGITSGEMQTPAAEMGEASGEKMMCMSCREMEMSVLALPCWHLCFCIVCGTHESILRDPCPVCETTITATAPVSLVSDEP